MEIIQLLFKNVHQFPSQPIKSHILRKKKEDAISEMTKAVWPADCKQCQVAEAVGCLVHRAPGRLSPLPFLSLVLV